jgi:hypothetical protein
MEGARYHRQQAEQCLQLARRTTDPLAANLLREAAARHVALAVEDEVRMKVDKEGDDD